ncbi:hypothetical protein PGTUg99_023119 [Puccinia graminis f. sp. tritici]|uniref:Uncharacterized protein n=1 Tax=Puccinia graminis f. sp. tritici TaxID=56615 RepID=A0A5B0MDT0_PUCGR|nr:hypothetical protein PGTUg99_023119 [Puccinia graminis f. sp. tritici]
MNTTYCSINFPFLQHSSPINPTSSPMSTSLHPSIFFPSTIKYSSTNFPASAIILNYYSSTTSTKSLVIWISKISFFGSSFTPSSASWIQNLFFLGSFFFFSTACGSSNVSSHIFPALQSSHFIFHYPSLE